VAPLVAALPVAADDFAYMLIRVETLRTHILDVVEAAV